MHGPRRWAVRSRRPRGFGRSVVRPWCHGFRSAANPDRTGLKSRPIRPIIGTSPRSPERRDPWTEPGDPRVTSSPQESLDVLLTSERLPSPSGVALQILELTASEDASVEDLQRVLVTDPALSGQLLKYANSARARGSTEVRSVSEAVVRLGMSTVRNLALGFSLLSAARSGPCERFDYNGFWSRSLATGVAAQTLGTLLRRVDPDEAFTCGLLGRIGQLGLASIHPRDYNEVLRRWDGYADDQLRELEREILVVDHDQLTVAMMHSWGLPERYTTSIAAVPRVDHEGEEAPGLARALSVAREMAEMCVADECSRPGLATALLMRCETLGFVREDVVAACDRALGEWTAMGETLDVITEDVPTLDELVDRARRQEPHTALVPDDIEQEPETVADFDAAAVLAESPLLDVQDQPLRVLVVDDSPLDRRIVTSRLDKEGHHVETAANGHEGLKTALRWNPHVILSDWMMPEMDGLELCRALRRSDEVSSVYVMMLTSNDQSDDLVTALDAGADDYLPKPINQAVLIARLRAAARVIRLQERAARDREAIRAFAADLSVANRKLQHMALYDTLTSLPNRRYAMDRLQKEWERAQRHGAPFLCMILDIDHFKKVNDTYGHDAGDVVLQRTAQAMKDCLRASDDVCRFGGEEFLCICPDADLEVAQVMGDRLRTAVEDNHIDTPGFTGHVTVSIGAAAFDPGFDSIDEMIKLADEALYAAKEAGRNKVCIVDHAHHA
ncbi:diguanylate cyclase [bacterium]|nr:diguanylate cyclase [bacterium]